MFELSGQFAVVTGAATGIGEAIAKRLADAGAKVCIVDIDPAEATAAASRIGCGAVSLALDITDAEAVKRSIGGLVAEHNAVDILVNNAGLAESRAHLGADRCRLAQGDGRQPAWPVLSLPRRHPAHAKAAGYGRIVNIASVAGKEGNPNMTALFGLEGRTHRLD